MSRHAISAHYVDLLPMLGLAVVFLWLWLAGVNVRELCSYAALTVTGYLRPRPDPAVEHALRTAFAELDRDLAAILGDRTPRHSLDSRPRSHQNGDLAAERRRCWILPDPGRSESIQHQS